ncbi:hypothetical protein D3C72_2266340 [compost metagenome]
MVCPRALSASVASKPPCAMPCMFECASFTRRASTLSASRRYKAPRSARCVMNGLLGRHGAKPSGMESIMELSVLGLDARK